MKNIDDTNIMQWMSRFLAGETTCTEEKKLYEYFSKEKLPAEAEPYREMMMWYAGGMQQPLPTQTGKSKPRVGVFQWRYYMSIAATVVVLFTLGFVFMKHQVELNEELAIYEGSYVVRDGKKYTDLKEILPELKRAELFVEQQEQVIPSADDVLAELVLEGTDDYTREIVKKAIFEN